MTRKPILSQGPPTLVSATSCPSVFLLPSCPTVALLSSQLPFLFLHRFLFSFLFIFSFPFPSVCDCLIVFLHPDFAFKSYKYLVIGIQILETRFQHEISQVFPLQRNPDKNPPVPSAEELWLWGWCLHFQRCLEALQTLSLKTKIKRLARCCYQKIKIAQAEVV